MNRKQNLVFIVAYNHENFICDVVRRIPAELLDSEDNGVLILDDGSRDGTFFTAESIRETLPFKAELIILKNPVNQGYGGNQQLGYRYAIDAGYERVFLIHGDGQYAPELLPTLIDCYRSKPRPDAVFGTRMHSRQAPLKGGMPLYKFLGNKTLTLIQNKLLQSDLSEFHSGYRSYSTELLRNIPFERNSKDFHFDTEIIIQTLSVGGKIKEVPIPTHYGEETCHVNGFKYAFNVLKASLHYRLQRFDFLYDRKFDTGKSPIPGKPTKFSAHSILTGLIPPGSKVLDIGCESSRIAAGLSNKGCVVDGVDVVDRDDISSPVNHYWQIDLQTELDKLSTVLAARSYDFIVMADILEHLLAPEYLLDVIRKHESPDTVVIAVTANVAFIVPRLMLFIGQFNYGLKGILDRTHRRLFTKKSFKHMFHQCGYTVIEESGITMPFSAVWKQETLAFKMIEATSHFFANLFPGLLSYQLLLISRPLPTTTHLLKASNLHSAKLKALQLPSHNPVETAKSLGEA